MTVCTFAYTGFALWNVHWNQGYAFVYGAVLYRCPHFSLHHGRSWTFDDDAPINFALTDAGYVTLLLAVHMDMALPHVAELVRHPEAPSSDAVSCMVVLLPAPPAQSVSELFYNSSLMAAFLQRLETHGMTPKSRLGYTGLSFVPRL